jgi:hypothetical protein
MDAVFWVLLPAGVLLGAGIGAGLGYFTRLK